MKLAPEQRQEIEQVIKVTADHIVKLRWVTREYDGPLNQDIAVARLNLEKANEFLRRFLAQSANS